MAADGKGGIVAMDHDGDGEEEDVVGRSEADLQFDDTVGHIEDVLISDDFQSLQDKFLEGNYKYFDQDDENKLEYTKIHQIYVSRSPVLGFHRSFAVVTTCLLKRTPKV